MRNRPLYKVSEQCNGDSDRYFLQYLITVVYILLYELVALLYLLAKCADAYAVIFNHPCPD